MPVGPSYVCFLVLSVAVASVPPRNLGEGRAACRGLWTKGGVGLGRGQLVSTLRAYQLPPSLLEAVPSIQQVLRKCWLSRGIQDLGRVGELVGSASRSREEARGAEKTPLRAARQAVWVLGGWGSADRGSPAAQGAKALLCLAGTCCPGNFGLKNPSRV